MHDPYTPPEPVSRPLSIRQWTPRLFMGLICVAGYLATVFVAYRSAADVAIYGPMEASRRVWQFLVVTQFLGYLLACLQVQRTRFRNELVGSVTLAILLTITLNCLYFYHFEIGELLVPFYFGRELSRSLSEAIACMIVYVLIAVVAFKYWLPLKNLMQLGLLMTCILIGATSFVSIPLVFNHVKSSYRSLTYSAMAIVTDFVLVIVCNHVSLCLGIAASYAQRNHRDSASAPKPEY